MYNRYIPQPDGTYQKNRLHEPPARQQRNKPIQASQDEHFPPPPLPNKEAERTHGGIMDFFKNLFPGEFDTGDLLIILILLLMAGDRKENNGNALLTLVLYLLM